MSLFLIALFAALMVAFLATFAAIALYFIGSAFLSIGRDIVGHLLELKNWTFNAKLAAAFFLLSFLVAFVLFIIYPGAV